MISTKGKIWIIAVLIGLVFWAGAFKIVFAGGIENATIYGIDRTVCGLQVPQAWINQELANGAVEHDYSANQALDITAKKIIQMQDYMYNLPASKVRAYCAARAAPAY